MSYQTKLKQVVCFYLTFIETKAQLSATLGKLAVIAVVTPYNIFIAFYILFIVIIFSILAKNYNKIQNKL